MGRRLLATSIVLLLVVATLMDSTREAQAVTATPIVNRTFYLLNPRDLGDSPPPSGTPAETNITRNKIEFGMPAVLLSGITVSGNINFSLWINSTMPAQVDITATFIERRLNGDNITLSIPFTQQLVQGKPSTSYKLNGTISQRTLLPLSRIFVSIVAVPRTLSNVTLLYGSSNYASLLILPLSGHVTLAANDPVKVLDSSGQRPADRFDLNATNKAVYFQANIFPIFGPTDLQRITVNMTLIAPGLQPVPGATNLTMSRAQFPTGPTYSYFAQWVYPSNSTEGTYQVYIDIIDGDQVAFRFRGPATFVLYRGLYLPPPLNLWPYFVAAGVGLVGGVFYYRRRRTRSYLAPFDHFNSLTGGEIDGGTVVAIEGNTGSGKTMLSQQLMFEDLKKGRPCVFVATGDFPSNIRAGMKNLGLDVAGYEQNGLLTFVDGYSSEAGQESREKFSTPSLSDLTTLGVKISSSLPSGSFKGGSLYFDSLTPLASKAKPESIVSFVQSVGARVKGMSGKAFFTVGPSVDGSVQRQLEDLSDCLVQMEAFEERGVRKSRLRVAKYRARKVPQGWVVYTIEDGKGIIFYSGKPKK